MGLEKGIGFALAMVGGHLGEGSLEESGSHRDTCTLPKLTKLSTGIRISTQVANIKHFLKAIHQVFEIF